MLNPFVDYQSKPLFGQWKKNETDQNQTKQNEKKITFSTRFYDCFAQCITHKPDTHLAVHMTCEKNLFLNFDSIENQSYTDVCDGLFLHPFVAMNW